MSLVFGSFFGLNFYLSRVFAFGFRSQYSPLRPRHRGMASKAQTALRIEMQMLKRAELLVPHLSRDPLMRAIGQVSRSAVLRVALAKGLEALESEHGGPSLPVPATAASPDGGAVVVFSDDWSELRQPRDRPRPQPSPPQAAGQRIRTLRDQGLSLRQIAAALTKEGIPTRRGGAWYASTVRAVLRRMDD